MEKPRRQEQEPASAEITEVAPSILRLQLPIELPGLGHVNCYALEDERGFALVDPGLPGPKPWKAMIQKLAASHIPLARVHTVIITHSHPDHYGGAGRLRKEAGAAVVTHRSFRTWWDPHEDDSEAADSDSESTAPSGAPWDQPSPWGGEPYRPSMRMRLARTMDEERRALLTPAPSKRVDDADVLRLAKRDWIAVHTPGHTPDHLCLFDPAQGVMLSGDHVLPTITPHISGIGNAPDPLAEFFRSLDRMTEFGAVTTVLPAHGHPFSDLVGRAKAIRHHHEERLEKLRAASHGLERPATVMELSQHLFSPRAWGSMAESETYAHLEHLRLLGQADRRDDGGVATYVVS